MWRLVSVVHCDFKALFFAAFFYCFQEYNILWLVAPLSLCQIYTGSWSCLPSLLFVKERCKQSYVLVLLLRPHSVLQFDKTSAPYLMPACSVFLLQSPNYWGPKQLSGTWSHVVHCAPSLWITKVSECSDALHAMLYHPFNKRLLRIRADSQSHHVSSYLSHVDALGGEVFLLTCGWQDGLVMGKTVLQVKVQDLSQLQSVWKQCPSFLWGHWIHGGGKEVHLFISSFHTKEKHWKCVCHIEMIRQVIFNK